MDQSIYKQQLQKYNTSHTQTCTDHCYHIYQGSFMRVLPDGHVLQKCCNCCSTRTVHKDHLGEKFGNHHTSVEISWR